MKDLERQDLGSAAPLWGWVLVGWLCASTLAAWVIGAGGEPPDAEALVSDYPPPETLADSSARELRSLPDIGPKLAVQIVEQRWEGKLDDPDTEAVEVDLEAVPGIGPKTHRAVSTFLGHQRGPWGGLGLDPPSAPRLQSTNRARTALRPGGPGGPGGP